MRQTETAILVLVIAGIVWLLPILNIIISGKTSGGEKIA
jgi:hypothetical protein